MRKTIFRKIAWIILLVVLLSDAALLIVSYRIAYNRSYDNCIRQLDNANSIVEQWVTYYNTDDEEDISVLSGTLNDYCNHLDLPYMYVMDVDVEHSTIKYLAIGFGEEATSKARLEVYAGLEKKLDPFPVELKKAVEGDSSHTVRHVKNDYGETLICYLPVRRKMDPVSGQIVERENSKMLIGSEISLSSVMEGLQQTFNMMTILLIVLSLMISFSVALILYRKVSKPARRISGRMSSFVEDYNQGFHPLPVKGQDEFAEMSRSFNTMADNISGYLNNIETLNREKHIRQAELGIAGDIQLGLLGAPYFEKDSFRIDARMHPAKDVGGDLYDYMLLDDGKVFISIADVSGKGITAALFMARAVTLLHQYAKIYDSPARILKEYNDILSEQNPGGLFITTFVAVYDPVTRNLTYSNGGHNIPYVLSDRLILLDEARCMAAGIFPGEDYEEATIRLNKGDMVFMYTDGVNEAVNRDGKLYSTERLEEELTKCCGIEEENVIRTISKDLIDYVDGAEQSDDITMLSMRVLTDEIVLYLKADKDILPRVKETVLSLPVDEDMQKKLYLAAEEIFINISSYAYKKTGSVEFHIVMKDSEDAKDSKGSVEMTFIDSGRRFDPTKDLQELEDYDYDTRIGGLGRFLTFTLADDYKYEYKDKKNVLWLKFQL